MSVSRPSEGFSVRGKTGSSMRLPLHSAGDHNGNAFPISSSSSSSSSSFLGELSPESLRSLSSLSGGRTDSPLDYDMFEVTLVTTVMTKTDEMTGVVVSKWLPEDEEEERSEVDNSEEFSAGEMQTAAEVTESNDNSVSIYLDANGGESRHDTCNNKMMLALALMANSGSESSEKRRHGSSTPDSEATEIPADDDDYDDEEESLFLSVSSDVGVRRSSMTFTSLTAELQMEGTAAESVAEDERFETGLEEPNVVSPLDILSI
ncbi:uncharacterized protein LKV04_001929 [Tautogolabrus adspersus]